MKKQILIIVLLFIIVESNAKGISDSIQIVHDKYEYYKNGEQYTISSVTIKNMSNDSQVLWLSDSCTKYKSQKYLLRNLFFKRKGDFSLLEIVNDNLTVPVELGMSFIKKIKKEEQFSFLLITKGKDSSSSISSLMNHLVCLKEADLESYVDIKRLDYIYFKYGFLVMDSEW